MDVRPARTIPWIGRGGGMHIVLAFQLYLMEGSIEVAGPRRLLRDLERAVEWRSLKLVTKTTHNVDNGGSCLNLGS